jgi:hypothetical protein
MRNAVRDECKRKKEKGKRTKVSVPFSLFSFFLFPFALLCLLAAFGCAKVIHTASTGSSTVQADDTLESVSETLRRGADIDACRTVVQQLNKYLDRHPDARPASLAADEKELLRTQYGLDAGELAEVASEVFTPLDAHYLEQVFLFRDALRPIQAGEMSPLDQVAAAFAWVMRQVGLRERPLDSMPPVTVLRRGWGSSRERALVFLAALNQLGIDGCMIALPAGPQGPKSIRLWIPAALVDREIYLFDTRLGLPLPGPEGRGIATLSQVRTRSDVFRPLDLDPKYPYDILPEQAKQAEVYVGCSLSALAPRMRVLQEMLASSEGVNLRVEPVPLLKRFTEATSGPAFSGSTVRVWNSAGDINTPFRLLRTFLPQTEGGTNPSDHRHQTLTTLLVPWQSFPRELADLQGEPGQRLRQFFAAPFLYVRTEPRMPKELLQAWLPGLYEQKSENQEGMRKAPDLILHGRMPRDLMLRSRLDDATNVLVTIHGELHRQQARPADPREDAEVRVWRERAVEVYGTLLRLGAASANPRGKTVVDANEVKAAKDQVTLLWANARSVYGLIQRAAAGPMSEDITFLLALCKQEQAERTLTRQQRPGSNKATSAAEVKAAQAVWKPAAGWWETYLDEHPRDPSAPTARLFRARALEALGQREAAARLLEDLSGDLTPLEKTARLYLRKRVASSQ